MIRRTALLTSVALAACGDDPEPAKQQEPPPVTPVAVIIRVDAEPPGERCAHGGSAVHSGLDADRDQVLDDGEIEATQHVCFPQPAPGAPGLLVRVEDEARGGVCDEGGTAIRAGLDLNRNGLLDELEITSTSYVCRDVIPVPVASSSFAQREDPCPTRGQVVEAGRDADGDRQLDDDETEERRYVCERTELTRVDVLPAGARCAAGGVAVHRGHDADFGNDLDDGEIARTEDVCGRVVERNLVIRTADDVSALQDVVAITGSLSFFDTAAVATVSLPSLRVVGGGLRVVSAPELTVLDAPVLRWIAADLRVITAPKMTGLDLPALEAVKSVYLNGNPVLSAVRLPGLVDGGGIFSISESAVTTLDLRSLVYTGDVELEQIPITTVALPALRGSGTLRLFTLPALTSFSAPVLQELSASVHVDSLPQLTQLDLRALTTVGGNFRLRYVRSLPRLDLPRLDLLAGSFTLDGLAALEEVVAPVLTAIPDPLTLADVPALRSLDGLAALEAVRALYLARNDRLVDLSGLRSLAIIGGDAEVIETRIERLALPALELVETLSIGGGDGAFSAANPLLIALDLPALRRMSALSVHDAARLARIELPTLEAVWRSVIIARAPLLRRCLVEAAVLAIDAPPPQLELAQVDDVTACP